MEPWIWPLHLVAFGVSAVACLVGAVRAWGLEGPVGGALAGFPFVTAAWAGAEALRLSATTFEAKPAGGGATLDVVGDDTVAVDRPRFVETCRRTLAFRLDRDATGVDVVTTADGFRVEADVPPVDRTVAERPFEYGQQAGSGDRMGLAVVDTLAAAQGWSVRVDADAPRLGSVFEPVAPVAPAP